MHPHLAPLVLDLLGHHLPHLAGAETRVLEFLDQGRGVVRARERVPDRLEQRQVLDPLRRPVRPNLGAGHAPDLLRVGLEEMAEQAIAEAVHHPVFEGLFLLVGEYLPLQVGAHDPEGLDRPQIGERVHRLERIVEELAPEEDAAQPRPGDEFGTADLVPDLLHFLDLGEEAVPADVETESVVALGPGDPAHQLVCLEHHRAVGLAQPLQFVGTRQARGATTDNRHACHVRKRHKVSPFHAITRYETGYARSLSGPYTGTGAAWLRKSPESALTATACDRMDKAL